VKILIAESAGVCFGVERALNLSESALTASAQNSETVTSLGPLIHNPQKVEELNKKGLGIAQNIDEIPEGTTVVFRSHGVPLSTQGAAQKRGLKVIDATCPLVKVPQNFARKLSDTGHFVVIVGDVQHPEIRGVKSYVKNDEGVVIKGVEEIEKIPSDKQKVGVICQTTLKASVYQAVVEELKKRFPEVKAHNTICSATRDRQAAAHDLAPQVDVVVVIGGKASSNTQKLLDICRSLCSRSHLVETPEDLKQEWFEGAEIVGLTAGASTPHSMIYAVRDRIAQFEA